MKFILSGAFFLIFIFSDVNVGFAQIRPWDNTDISVIGKKELQNENYISASKSGPNNTTTFNTLLRYGVSNDFELQVGWTGIKTTTLFDKFSDQHASVGLKGYLIKDSKYLPGLSFIASVNLTPDPEELPIMPSLNLLFDKKLGNNFKLNGNYKLALDEQESQIDINFSVNLEVAVTQWQSTYVGIVGSKKFLESIEKASYNEYVEVGMFFWVKDGITIYPFYDFGLGDDSDDVINLGAIFMIK